MFAKSNFTHVLCGFLLTLFLAGCGGGGGAASASSPTPQPSPTSVSVIVSPSSGTVQVAHTLAFTSTVSGTSNQSVTWSVNSVAGGNSSLGTISSSGLYTAPITVPSPATIAVSATSSADSTKSASAGLTIVPPPSPAGTWSRIAPFGGIMSNLVVDPNARNVVYVAAFNSGVFRSTDTGQTWAPVISPAQASFSTNQVSSIAVGTASSTLYFVNGVLPNTMTLYSSTDRGVTTSSKTLPQSVAGAKLQIDPANDHILYLSGQNGISKSTDGGSTWTNLANAPSNVNVVKISPAASSTVYAGTTSGVFKSSDSGSSWSSISTGIDPSLLNIADLAVDPSNTQRLVAAANTTPGLPGLSGHIYSSSNGGASWTETTAGGNGWLFQPVNQIQLNGSTLYAAINPFNPSGPALPAVLKSGDGGTSWSAAATGLPSSSGAIVLASTAPDILLFGTNGPESLLKSHDGGTTWNSSATGISGFNSQRVAFDSGTSTLYFAAVNNGGLWKSSDLGISWTNLLNDSIFAIAVDPANSQHLLASDFQSFLLQSTNAGATWSQITTPLGLIDDIQFSSRQAGLVLICSRSGGIARSTDNGSTWTTANTGLQVTDCRQIAFDPIKPTVAFAAMVNGIYGSSDSGVSWTLKRAGSEEAIRFDPANSSVIYAGGASGFVKSTDGGSTWNQLAVPNIAQIPAAIAIDPLSHNTVYVTAFGSDTGVAVSSDAGLTWAPVNNGLGFSLKNDLVVIPGTSKLFTATFNNGLLQFQ